jgi:EmrB/QacA subfamily drug resistance transporter
MTVTDAAVAAPDPEAARRQRVLVAMCLALAAVIASVSSLNVALQDLAVEFGASQGTLLWIINAYTLSLAALLLAVGAIGDRWGRRPILLGGLALFAGASLASALATSAEMMLVTRAFAGVAAAMIMPVTLSVITSTFPDEQRARAVGIWAGVAGGGGILGLFFSSFVVDYFEWPWLFSLPIALAVAAFAMAWRDVHAGREPAEGRFDTWGSILSVLAVGGLVLGIHEGPEKGWGHWLTIGGLVIGVAALAAFVAWEMRQEHPLLDVRVFANRGLAAGSLTLLVVFAVMFGIFLVLMQFLQAVVGFSALRSAAGLLPMAAAMMPLSSVAPIIAKRVGAFHVLVVGVALFGTGLALLATMSSVSGGYLSILPGLVVMGAGMGLSMTPSTMAITESLPLEKQGVASALNDTVRELGGAVGIALLGSVLNSAYRSNVTPATDALPPELAEPVREGIGGALAVGGQLGQDGAPIVDAARTAFVDGWHTSMWVGVAMAIGLWTFLIVRAPKGALTRGAAPAPALSEPEPATV